MIVTHRRVLIKAGYSDTWLEPWVGFIFKIKEYKSGKKIAHTQDGFGLSINGYMKYFSKPLKRVGKKV